MSDTTYNGWKNYETWLVNLWFTNDQYTSEEVNRVVSEIKDALDEPDPKAYDDITELSEALEEYESSKEDIPVEAADALKDWTEDYLYDILDTGHLGDTIFSDLLRNALSEVDWLEWATSLLED
jgi:hypothetical protein